MRRLDNSKPPPQVCVPLTYPYPPPLVRAVKSPTLAHVNVHANARETLTVVNSVVNSVVNPLDRLPTENSPEALYLLHEAWCEYDVAMHLATQYKYIAKFLYAMHLAVGVAIVVFGVVLGTNEGSQYAPTALHLPLLYHFNSQHPLCI